MLIELASKVGVAVCNEDMLSSKRRPSLPVDVGAGVARREDSLSEDKLRESLRTSTKRDKKMITLYKPEGVYFPYQRLLLNFPSPTTAPRPG